MKRLYKWLIGLFIFVLLVILVLQFLVTPWLEQKANRAMEDSSGEQFKVSASNLEINLFKRTLDTDSLYLFLQKPGSSSNKTVIQEWELKLQSVRAQNISIWHLLVNDRLSIGQLNLGITDLMVQKIRRTDTVDFPDELVERNISSIVIHDLNVDSSTFTLWDSLQQSKLYVEISAVNGNIELIIPSDAAITIVAKNSNLRLSKSIAELPGAYYELGFEQCTISGKDSLLRIDSLNFTPLLEKYEFSQKYGYRTDRVVMDISEIQINDLDVKTLVDKGKFNAGMLIASNMYFDIFRDARLPFAPWKHTILLQRKISQLPFAFTIDSTKITDSYLRYEEKRLDELGTGHLELEDLNIFGNRITNDTSLIKETVYKVNGEALFMGQGELSASIEFPLDRINGHHTVSGHLGPMPIPPVNKVLYPLTKFRVEKGQNDNVYFNMAVDETEATGDLRFYYHDLKVNMETEKEKWINNISSFLANRLIREENPKNGKFRRGIISYERDTRRSIFNYWWKALRSGLLTSVGISPGVTEEE